ncbi:MAG: FprA family A-type flavoprotein [Candidatus Bipolaricaulis sp.]|nr:FprA family A-type flavoprotein [Candidatus Bipolaricaulis sp.]MDD5646304.1 FprA family A-type flavoprotein [Candidatus Bipolaricaulis sp.]
MSERSLLPGIDRLAAEHWDRRLFDELIPLPDGTSYNAYLVRGSQRTALIDTVDPTQAAGLLSALDAVGRVDDLVIQHVEQDHSGTAPAIVERYPDLRILSSPKAKPMIADHLGIPAERVTAVEDRETVSLGDRTLEFIHAPWVHWPETMLTYLREDHVLFPCDLFGSHLATSDLYATDRTRVYEAAKRYYAEIMMPFAALIRKHLERLRELDIRLIAPSHGPAYADPAFIIDAYRHWVNDPPSNLVLIPYASMHDSTARMVDSLVDALARREIAVQPFNMTVTDIGQYALRLVDAATVVFATPTVLVGPHPSVVFAAYLTAALRPKLRYAATIGSFGWAGKAAETVRSLCSSLQVEWLDSVFARGAPTPATYKALDALADEIATRHRGLS